jgi:hypothetical protein
MEKRRAVLSLLLVAVGAGLLVYGLGFRSAVTASSDANAPAVSGGEAITPASAKVAAPLSEAAVTQEVARGGLTRDASGAIKKTSEGGTQAGKACPT